MDPSEVSAPGARSRRAPRRPRVLFIINSLNGGGAERVMAKLLNLSEPRRANHDISLALLDNEERAYPIPEWVDVHQLDCRHSMWASITQLRHLIRELAPDVTLSFLTRANVASAFAAAGRGKPWIISERVNTSAHLGRGARGTLAAALVRLTYPRASLLLSVSDGVARTLVQKFGVAAQRIEVIANPVDADGIRRAATAEAAVDIQAPYVLALGRLVPAKNHALLINAFARSGLDGQLVIAGEGPERARLAALAAQLGIGGRVMLPGYLANPYPVLRRARIFALSSNAEGFPNALVEALALGIPVVATNCPDGPAEILAGKTMDETAGVTVAPGGILTPPGDMECYAQALGLADDEGVRSTIIAGGMERVSAYSPQASAERYWAVIQDQLARSGSFPEVSSAEGAED